MLIKFYTPLVCHFRCLWLKGTHGAVQLTGRSRHTVVAYEAFVCELADDYGALYTCQTLMPQRRLIGCTLWFAPISLGVNGKEGGGNVLQTHQCPKQSLHCSKLRAHG